MYSIDDKLHYFINIYRSNLTMSSLQKHLYVLDCHYNDCYFHK